MWRSLAGLVGHDGPLDAAAIERLAAHSLVRALEPQVFDPAAAAWNRRVRLSNTDGPVTFEVARNHLPDHLPAGWSVEQTQRQAGARGHRRWLRPAGAGSARDRRRRRRHGAARVRPQGALRRAQPSAGAAADDLRRQRRAGQPGDRLVGRAGAWWRPTGSPPTPAAPCRSSTRRATAACWATGTAASASPRSTWRWGWAQMAADFTNAYVLGSLGQTGHNMGACATFLYNLQAGCPGHPRRACPGGLRRRRRRAAAARRDRRPGDDGRAGHRRVAARDRGQGPGRDARSPPRLPPVRRQLRLCGGRGSAVPGADGRRARPRAGRRRARRRRRGLRPRRRAQEVDLGARDRQLRHLCQGGGRGGPGCWARTRCGGAALSTPTAPARRRTGSASRRSSTPWPRAFDIEQWPVAAVKCYVGHTMAAAGGDQIVSAARHLARRPRAGHPDDRRGGARRARRAAADLAASTSIAAPAVSTWRSSTPRALAATTPPPG